MGNGFRQDRGPWPGGGKIPVFPVAIMIVTDLPWGRSVTITAWRTSLPSGADYALGLGGRDLGPAAGDADGDEVADAGDDEADEPGDVGAADDPHHRAAG